MRYSVVTQLLPAARVAAMQGCEPRTVIRLGMSRVLQETAASEERSAGTPARGSSRRAIGQRVAARPTEEST